MLGDKIVADRRERLANPRCTEREATEILAKPAPRSMTSGTWPPSKADRDAYAAKRKGA